MDDLNDDDDTTREDESVEPTEVSYRNYYQHCGTQWNDVWDCKCNDKCPVCSAEVTPYRSVDITDGEESVSVHVDGVTHAFDLPLSYEDYLQVHNAIKPEVPSSRLQEESLEWRDQFLESVYQSTERWAGIDNPNMTVADRCHASVAQALLITRGTIEGFPEPFHYPAHSAYAARHDMHKEATIKSKMASSMRDLFD